MKGKRILICCNRTLNIGGIEKALTTFLRAFDTEENEVLLVLHDTKGSLHAELPLDHIQVFYVDSVDAKAMLKDDILHFRLMEIAKGLWNRFRLHIEKDWYARIMYTYRIIQRKLVFPGHFDCAISFTSDYSDLSMICRADADKRVAFVHGDATRGERAARLNDHLFHQIDKIYSVSSQAGELFVQMHPQCKEAVDVLHNVILPQEIRDKATAPPKGMILDGTLTLCTVGRLSPEKGQMLIPPTADLLRQAGYDLRWYLVGGGGLETALRQEISRRGLQSHVILLGPKVNPYPYIKNCDIYVQTSLSEAYCITIAEARILHKPIVTTDAPGIREQCVHGENSLIADAMTAEALAGCIRTLLTDTALRERLIRKLIEASNTDFAPLIKLYEFIES